MNKRYIVQVAIYEVTGEGTDNEEWSIEDTTTIGSFEKMEDAQEFMFMMEEN